MKVLLLGADGALGEAFLHTIREPSIRAWTKADLNLEDLTSIVPTITAERPEVIVNCAAYTDVDGAEDHQPQAIKVNALAVGEIGRAGGICNARVVHFSTDYVFAGRDLHGYSENDQPEPINIYGWSKLYGEQLLRNQSGRALIIRTSRLFGPIGAAVSGKKNFVRLMIEQSQKKKTVEVVNAERSSPTLTTDLAEATLEVLRGYSSGIFHRTNDQSCTWFEFATEIFSQIGWRGTIISVPASRFQRRAQRPAVSVLRTTRRPPLRSWKLALHEYLLNEHFL